MVQPLLGYVHKDLSLKIFYYCGSKDTASRALQLVLNRVDIYYEADYITPSSSACDLTLKIYPSDPLKLNSLQDWI
jgi:hypothetical protein